MRFYRSKDGDTADSIAWDVYGRQDQGLVEALLDQNPGLAALGAVLPAGVRVIIPPAPEPEVAREVRLWS